MVPNNRDSRIHHRRDVIRPADGAGGSVFLLRVTLNL